MDDRDVGDVREVGDIRDFIEVRDICFVIQTEIATTLTPVHLVMSSRDDGVVSE